MAGLSVDGLWLWRGRYIPFCQYLEVEVDVGVGVEYDGWAIKVLCVMDRSSSLRRLSNHTINRIISYILLFGNHSLILRSS